MSSKQDLQKDLDIIKGKEIRSGAKGPNASRQQMKSKKAKKRSLPADGEKSENSGVEGAASVANVRQKIAHKRSRTESPSGGKVPEKARRTSGFGKIKLGGKQNEVSSNPSTPRESSRPDPPKQTPRSRGCIDPQAVPVEAIQFKVGCRMEAMDQGSWYKARIIEVDNTKSEILVHFDGWRSTFDTWYPMTSALIRGRTQIPNKDGEVVFEEGEDVLARWTDGNFYLATVVSVGDTRSCVVMYFDGMKKLIRKNVMKKMNDKEKAIATEAANKLLQIPTLIPTSPEIAGKPSYRTSATDREKRVPARRGRVSDASSVTPVSTPSSTPVRVQTRVKPPKPDTATPTTPTNSTEVVKKKRRRPRKSTGIATPPSAHVKSTEKILPSSPLVAKSNKKKKNSIDKQQNNEINKSKNIEYQQNNTKQSKMNSERFPPAKNKPSPIPSNQKKTSESDDGRDSKASRLGNIISKMVDPPQEQPRKKLSVVVYDNPVPNQQNFSIFKDDDHSAPGIPLSIKQTNDLTTVNASEEDKIKAMMSQATNEYDPSNFVRQPKYGTYPRNAPQLPSYLRCHKCNQTGHYATQCLVKLDTDKWKSVRHATGIPRSQMIQVSKETRDAMLTSDGKYVVPVIDNSPSGSDSSSSSSQSGSYSGSGSSSSYSKSPSPVKKRKVKRAKQRKARSNSERSWSGKARSESYSQSRSPSKGRVSKRHRDERKPRHHSRSPERHSRRHRNSQSPGGRYRQRSPNREMNEYPVGQVVPGMPPQDVLDFQRNPALYENYKQNYERDWIRHRVYPPSPFRRTPEEYRDRRFDNSPWEHQQQYEQRPREEFFDNGGRRVRQPMDKRNWHKAPEYEGRDRYDCRKQYPPRRERPSRSKHDERFIEYEDGGSRKRRNEHREDSREYESKKPKKKKKKNKHKKNKSDNIEGKSSKNDDRTQDSDAQESSKSKKKQKYDDGYSPQRTSPATKARHHKVDYSASEDDYQPETQTKHRQVQVKARLGFKPSKHVRKEPAIDDQSDDSDFGQHPELCTAAQST